MYKISKLTYKIYDSDFIEVPQDDREQSFLDFLQWLNNGGIVEEIEATSEEIAEQELEQQKLLKQQQYEELLPTDWYVVRFMETGVEIPEEILKQRQEIRDKYK